jgi:VWFA-related protein
MLRICKLICLAALASILLLLCASAQQQPNAPVAHANSPAPSPTPPPNADESIKVFTEEVRIPVFAYDDYGNFERAIEPADLLVLEDGVPQTVRSVRHIPANVLLLLDTGGESVGTGGVSKSTSLTRQVALGVVAGLHNEDQIALMQFSDHPEMLQDWTTDKQKIVRALKTKLHADKRVRLTEAIASAAQSFKNTPEGSRHVLLVTDGVETPGGSANRAEALKQLYATRATVHIISYTEFVRQKQSDKTKNVPNNAAIQQQSSTNIIANAGINPNPVSPSLPPSSSGGGNRSGGRGFTFDPAMSRLRKAYEADVKQSQQWLTYLAAETGGRIWLPVSAQEMVDESAKVAHDIGAQYVVTYTPKRLFVNAPAGEYRRLEIAPRKLGLTLRTRRGYVAMPPASTVNSTKQKSAS